MNMHDDSYIDDPAIVVDLGGGEEYFAEDYDIVHCRHGRYIGYPSGADYMCPECESGRDTPIEYPAMAVLLYVKPENGNWERTEYKTRYALRGLLEDSMLLDTAAKFGKKMADAGKDAPYVEIEFYVEGDWATEQEAQEYNTSEFFTDGCAELAQTLLDIAGAWRLK